MSFSLKAVFGIDATGVKTEIRQLRRELNSFVQDYAKLGAGLAIGAFVALSKGALDLASNLKDAAGQIGINVEALQALHYAATQNGSSVESMNKALEKLRLNVRDAFDGNKELSAALQTLGLSAKELIGLPLEQVYSRVALATKNATDKSAAYNAVSQLFGSKIGPDQINVLNALANDGFPKTAKAAADAGQVMSAETIVALEKASQAIDDFKKRATIAVGNILVNFRSEEGLKLLLFQLLRVVGVFGAKIVDAFSEAGKFTWAVFSSVVVGIAAKLRDGFLDAVAVLAAQLNKVLPDRFEINVANIEALKSSGESIAERITRAIADTKPSTFARDVGQFWDSVIKDQQAVVTQLNNTELKKDADSLRSAGKQIQESGARAAADLKDGGAEAADKIRKAAEDAKQKFRDAGESLYQQTKIIFDRAAAVLSPLGARNGATLSGMDDATLEEIIRRNRNQALALKSSPTFGDPLSGSGIIDRLNVARLTQEALNAQRELDIRNNFRRDIDMLGVDRARQSSSLDPEIFARLLQQFGPGADTPLNKQTQLLTDIRDRLKRPLDTISLNPRG